VEIRIYGPRLSQKVGTAFIHKCLAADAGPIWPTGISSNKYSWRDESI